MLLRTTALALISSALLPSLYANAQAPAGDDDDLRDLEVIFVTSQRREQSLLDVPISVSVISGDSLEDENILSTAELGALVPSLNFPGGGTRAFNRPLIRGIGDSIPNGTDSNVGVYLDDVPLPNYLADFDLLDVSRVEVLKGPQGTLFGQNGLAGAINVITRGATDEIDAAAQIAYGSFEEFDVQGYISGPITDGIRAKLVARYNEFGGFIDNTATGGKIDPADSISLRGVLTFDVTEEITLDVIADYSDFNGSNVNDVPLGTYEKAEPAGNFGRRDNFGIAARVNYDGEAFDVVSITSYREFTYDDFLSSLGFANTFVNDQRQFSQEVRFSSSIGDKVDWLVGGYFFDENFTQDQSNMLTGLLDLSFSSETNNQTIAAFGDVTIHVTDRLDVIGGLRYTNVGVDGGVDTDFFSNFAPGLAPPVNLMFENNSDLNFDEVSARAALLFRVTDDITLFGTWANGFKPGTFSLFSFQPNDPSVGTETANSFEIGLRGTLFDNRVSFELAAFTISYDNRQTTEDVPFTGGGVVRITNAGEGSRSQGIEASGSWQVTNTFTLSTSFAYLDTELENFVINQFLGTDVDVDLSGNEFFFAPNIRATIGWDYTQPITSSIAGFLRGRWRYVGEQFADDANDLVIESYNLVNLSAGAEVGKFIISLDVENVFDEYYALNLTDAGSTMFTGVLGAIPGAPRSFLGRVRFRF
ncbi:MAG: TonB-dependent receptor [Pseudomonadota bacterium]